MNLWLLGALSGLQILAAGALSLLSLRPTAYSLAAGATSALLLFGFLPQALRLCGALVLAPALVLGIILSVFLRESVPKTLYAPLIWSIWLTTYAFLQADGVLPICSLLYLVPIVLALPRFQVRDILWSALPLASFAAGCRWGMSGKWQGLLLSVACGIMLGCIPHHKTQSFAGGIAIGVILSFL